jgi:hypothetical protein
MTDCKEVCCFGCMEKHWQSTCVTDRKPLRQELQVDRSINEAKKSGINHGSWWLMLLEAGEQWRSTWIIAWTYRTRDEHKLGETADPPNSGKLQKLESTQSLCKGRFAWIRRGSTCALLEGRILKGNTRLESRTPVLDWLTQSARWIGSRHGVGPKSLIRPVTCNTVHSIHMDMDNPLGALIYGLLEPISSWFI